MQGGKVVVGDLTVRNTAGYPIKEDGSMDIEAMKRETQQYIHTVSYHKRSDKASNIIPPKKKRK